MFEKRLTVKSTLREFVEKLDLRKNDQSTANTDIKLNFNPPVAKHFGVAHVRIVKT